MLRRRSLLVVPLVPIALFIATIGLSRAAEKSRAGLEGSLGLVQTVYDTEEFSGMEALRRVTTRIDLSVFDERPDIEPRFVSVTWSGIWLVPTSGAFDIHAGADDLVRVLIDDRLVIERNERTGFETQSAPVTLVAGPHRLRIEFMQIVGGIALDVRWAPAGRAPRYFEPESLFVSPPNAALIGRARWAARLRSAATSAWYAFVGVTAFLVLFFVALAGLRSVRSGVPQAAIRRVHNALSRWGDRHGRPAIWLLTGAAVCWTAVRWGSGLNPETLWSDDVAVACLAKVESLWAAVSVTAPLPPGFVALLWITRRVVPDPELSLQLWPLVFGLLGPLVVGLAVSRLTASRLLGFIASVLGFGTANLAQYAIFVKPYSLDYLATAVMLLLGVGLLVDRRTRLWPVAVTGLVSVFFALPSIMTVIALVHAGALVRPADQAARPAAPWRRWAAVVCFDAVLAAVYLLTYRHRSNPDLRAYWVTGFAPTSSLADLGRFLSTTGWTAIREALPGPLMWLAPLAAVGLFSLVWTARCRWFAVFVVTCFGGALVASMLQVYPIGIGANARVSIFAYPLVPALVAIGMGTIARWLPARELIHAAAALAIAAVVASVPPPAYPPLDLSRLARDLESSATRSDAVVVNTPASHLAGYYTTWPIALWEDGSPYGYAIRFPRPLTLTLPRSSESGGQGLDVLDRFLRDWRPARLFLFTTRRPTEAAERVIQAQGYEETRRTSSRISTRLIEYRRAGTTP